MNAIALGSDGFYHPGDEAEICQLVQYANLRGLKIRVRGAGHSVASAIYTHRPRTHQTHDGGLNLMLDKMYKVTFDDARMQVTVQGGCHLGKDPSDPTQTSTEKNSLFYQLDQRGWALPTTGGIIHQTVAGFLATGSAGGTLMHSLGEHIVAIRVVDGTGMVHELAKDKDRDKFYAAGVSLGLLGIITAVTFQCVEKFHVMGQETTTKIADCKVDLFGAGRGADRPSLQAFLESTEHARLLWWPQQGVEKVTVWEAHNMQAEDYTAQTGTPEDFKPQPYQQFPRIFGSDSLAQVLAGLFYRMPAFLQKLLVAPAINLFSSTVGEGGTQKFWDTWWKVLPMDNRLSDKWIPYEFSELWIPISKTLEVVRKLCDHYRNSGFQATRALPCEIYVKKKSPFWMNPAYQQDVVRINLFWFGRNKQDPVTSYFPQFWQLLQAFDYRLHWGKYLPADPSEYLRSRYPKWDDFMKIRAEMDPNQIFVSDYWRTRLGIDTKTTFSAASSKTQGSAVRL
ncbi:MAG: D-arabinono-1,4-lactone oxidase [bacterium]